MSIDWAALARQLGTIHAEGETTSSDDARKAIELLLGEESLREAVDHYIRDGAGRGLARGVLSILQPWSAMRRCYEIYRSEGERESRHAAVELLRMVADRRALPWVREFLSDPDSDIAVYGVGVLDQLLWKELIEPAECEEHLRFAEEHVEPAVRESVAAIRSYLAGRASAKA